MCSQSESNSTVSRNIGLSIYCLKKENQELFDHVEEDCDLTNPNEVVIKINQLITLVFKHLILGTKIETIQKIIADAVAGNKELIEFC